MTVSVWRFNTGFIKKKKKKEDKNNRKLKILYKCIQANNTSAIIWQHMLHIPPTKIGRMVYFRKRGLFAVVDDRLHLRLKGAGVSEQ